MPEMSEVPQSLPLPAGGATSANQSTEITNLGNILTQVTTSATNSGTAATSALQTTGNTSLSTIATNTPAKGQATKANSSPVTMASDQGDQFYRKTVLSTVSTPSIASATTALAANSSRRYFYIMNLSINPLFVMMGSSASTTVFHKVLKACTLANDGSGGDLAEDQWQGIVSIAGTSSLICYLGNNLMLFNNSTLGGGTVGGPTVYPPYEQWGNFDAANGVYKDTAKTTPVSVSGTDTCAVWADLTSTAQDVWQSSSGLQPIWFNGLSDGPNNKPYLKFDGSNDYLITRTPFTATDTTDDFIVIRIDTWVSTRAPYTSVPIRNVRMNSASPQLWLGATAACSTIALGTWQKLHLRYSGLGDSSSFLANYTGNITATLSSAIATTTQVSLAALQDGTLPAGVSIARLLRWKRVLSPTEITTVNTYLTTLYGV